MEGAFFFWVLWLFIIFIYFFVDSPSNRSQLLTFSLLTVILSSFHKTFVVIEYNTAWLSFLFICIISMTKLTKSELIKGYAVSFIIGQLFFAVYSAAYIEAVWLLFDARLMIVAGSLPLLIVFLRNVYTRVFSLIAGMFQGVIMTKGMYLLASEESSRTLFHINGLFVLDVLSLVFMTVMLWAMLEYGAMRLKNAILPAKMYPAAQKRRMNA